MYTGSSVQSLGRTFKSLMAVSTAIIALLAKLTRPGHQRVFLTPADVST